MVSDVIDLLCFFSKLMGLFSVIFVVGVLLVVKRLMTFVTVDFLLKMELMLIWMIGVIVFCRFLFSVIFFVGILIS